MKVLGTVLAFFVAALPLQALGVQENQARYDKAREMIAQKNYDGALELLVKVVKEEPDRLDDAQALIRQVEDLRRGYNELTAELVRLLNAQEDEQKILAQIARVEQQDGNPNAQTKDLIKSAKRTARLNTYRKKNNDIMTRALAALNRREYAGAVTIYLEGQDLGRDMFLEAEFGNVFNNPVDRSWTDLKAAAGSFVKAEAALKAAPAAGTAALAAETLPSAALEGQLSALRDLASWRQRSRADALFFKSQNDFLVKNGRPDEPYLVYSSGLVFGRADAKTPEGILGAFDRLWAEILDPWAAQVRTGTEARYAQAKTAFDKGDWEAARAGFEALRVRARQGLDVLALWNRTTGFDAQGVPDPVYQARQASLVPLQVWLDHRLTLALEGLEAVRTLPRTAALAATPAGDRPALEASRAEVRGYRDLYAADARRASGWSAQAQQLSAAGFTPVDTPAFGTAWAASWNVHRQAALVLEADLVDRRGGLDYGLLDGRFQDLQVGIAAARTQIEGAVKYPLQAAAALQQLRPLQDALGKDITAFVTLYEAEPAEVRTPAVQRWPSRGRELFARLTNAQTLQGQLLATAQANYGQSQQLKKQGQDVVPGVDPALAAENFTQAKAVINQASTRYSQSLALQEDPDFRTESDAQIKALLEKVAKAENEVVVRDVRKLITQGSQAYLGQQFTQAAQILGRARNRWAVTNPDPNPEVEYWLGLVSYATSVVTGRELSPIDPLYNEVQQLLNFARRDLGLGKDRITAGRKDEGQSLMKEAREVLSKILLPFPQNQEARLLTLEILKASDPENFPVLFQQNFDAAVAKITKNPSEAYNDLLDLKQIQPDQPGLDAAIKKVRLELRLDRPPVDLAALAQAKTLTAQAARLVAGGSQAQLAQAQDLVAQALVKDPANTAAQDLKDQISIRLKPPVIDMNVTQKGELAAIFDLARNQRVLEALSQYNEFLAKYPNLRTNKDVVETGRRIKALAG